LKKPIIFLIAFIMIFTPFGSIYAKSNTDTLGIEASGAILIEASTGKILYEKDADVPLKVASMTKMMTEYLVLEAIDKGRIKWNQTITISDYVHNISQRTDLSNVPLEKEFKYNVKELYESMAIYSANGSTIALAELVGGSETNFVTMMNKKGKQLGLKNFKFVNSTGLNNEDLQGKHPAGTSADEENVMSSRDTALLAYKLINKYPEVLETAKVPKKTFQEGGKYPIKMDNWNWMLPSLVYGYEGVDGIKTGSTPQAGYCFTGTAKRNNVRLISVVMETKSYKARFDETKKLFDYGFNNFALVEIFKEGTKIKEKNSIGVLKGKEDSVKIKATDSVSIFVKNGEKPSVKQKLVLDKKLLNENKLTAPVKSNKKVGELILSIDDETDYGFIDDVKLSSKVVTTDNVEKANWFVLLLRGIGSFFGNLFDLAGSGIKSLF
jgi:D-alanyl-D-alanine carboxypeptidase (penicillin-binding protein 5/6)